MKLEEGGRVGEGSKCNLHTYTYIYKILKNTFKNYKSGKMAQCGKELATKPNNLSSILGIHMVNEVINFYILSSDFLTCTMSHIHVHTYTHACTH